MPVSLPPTGPPPASASRSPAARALVRMLRVLIADDSPTVRHFLAELVAEAPDMTVVGQAADGAEAVALAADLRPDVISMDLKMPRLDGLGAIEQLMRTTPIPVIVVSGYVRKSGGAGSDEADLAFAALQAGALAVLATPPHRGHPDFAARRDEFLTTLRAMAGVSLVRRWLPGGRAAVAAAPAEPGSSSEIRPAASGGGPLPRQPVPTPAHWAGLRAPEVIVIGASAGGPVALRQLLAALPGDLAVPVAIVQHMAEGFIGGLVRWLDEATPLRVTLAEHGQFIGKGQVVVAGTAAHLTLRRAEAGVQVVLKPEAQHRTYLPSVDVLFESAAQQFEMRAVGVLLTGMGDDGAAGLLALRQCGARTLVQDEATCLVYGMPRAAVKLGAAERILPLEQIAPAITRLAQRA